MSPIVLGEFLYIHISDHKQHTCLNKMSLVLGGESFMREPTVYLLCSDKFMNTCA